MSLGLPSFHIPLRVKPFALLVSNPFPQNLLFLNMPQYYMGCLARVNLPFPSIFSPTTDPSQKNNPNLYKNPIQGLTVQGWSLLILFFCNFYLATLFTKSIFLPFQSLIMLPTQSFQNCFLKSCQTEEQQAYSRLPIDIIKSNRLQFISQFIMGGSSSTTNRLDIDILTEFKQIKKEQSGLVLQHNQNQQTFLLKQFTYATDIQYEQQRARFERQINHGLCQNVLAVFKIKTHTIQGLCSTTHKIYAVYQYPQVNLQDEIQARQKEEKRFDENELWSILQSCNTALSYLKSTISLNTLSVYITPQGQLKVIHNDMIDENYRYAVNERYFYAPQKMNNFNKIDSEVGLAKEAVFSMGMTLLQAALLEPTLDCYDYSQFIFVQNRLIQYLENLESIYSPDFIQILSVMLDTNPNRRPSFSQIQRLLDNYWASMTKSQQNTESKNGDSLKIHGEQKRLLMTSQEQKGIFKNLATVNSQQKQSVRPNDLQPTKKVWTNKIVESIEPQIRAQEAQNRREMNIKSVQLSKPHGDKQNIYTDPKLLEMIKRDLQDINKLKQSTLKETIKYSFLYPQSDAIFSSIKDAKLSVQYKNSSNGKIDEAISHKRSIQIPLQQSVPNIIVTNQFNSQNKVASQQQQFIDKYQDKRMKTSIMNLIYTQQVDNEGHQYTGYTLNGKKHGKGKLMFDDGAFYEGQFLDDQMNGRGILYYKQNKPAYDGKWFNGQFHGQGVLYNQNPQFLDHSFDYKDFDQVEDYWRKYQGEFNLDNKCGVGRLYLTNGEVIEGTFQNDLINGRCQFRDMNGQCINGLWEMNRLVEIDQL